MSQVLGYKSELEATAPGVNFLMSLFVSHQESLTSYRG